MSWGERAARHVAVLCGGISAEREVSRCSGANAATALKEAGYSVEMLDPADPDFLTRIVQGGYDAAFISLHGRGGEDGMIQHILEYLGIPYTASDAFASTCAADKGLSKLIYEQAGIPVARGVVIKRGETVDERAIVAKLGDQLFVKPAVNGSSYGVSKVKDASALRPAIEHAFAYDDKVLVEECLVGTEITVGVYGDEVLEALPVVEIQVPECVEFYDQSVKYIDPTDIHRIPARICARDYERAQQLACQAHRALGCFGISRSDFIVTEEGPVIMETNTIPGHTDASLYPDELRYAQKKFSDICAGLIEMAIARAAVNAKR